MDEEKLRAASSGMSAERILRNWRAGQAMAAIDLAMQERLIDVAGLALADARTRRGLEKRLLVGLGA